MPPQRPSFFVLGITVLLTLTASNSTKVPLFSVLSTPPPLGGVFSFYPISLRITLLAVISVHPLYPVIPHAQMETA